MDCSPQDSSIHGIFQARILEWVAISFSRGSSWPRSPSSWADALPSEPPTKMTIQRKTTKAKRVLYKAIEERFPKSFPFLWPIFYCSIGNEGSSFPVFLWGIVCLLFLEFKHCHIFKINLMSIPQCYFGLCSTRKRLFKLYSDTMSIHPFVLNKFFHRIHAWRIYIIIDVHCTITSPWQCKTETSTSIVTIVLSEIYVNICALI